MNYLTIFLYYFSEPRFSEIQAHFGIKQGNNKGRANLITQLLESENFQEDLLMAFLYKAELQKSFLQNFCNKFSFGIT